jgi:hypothetical protein
MRIEIFVGCENDNRPAGLAPRAWVDNAINTDIANRFERVAKIFGQDLCRYIVNVFVAIV